MLLIEPVNDNEPLMSDATYIELPPEPRKRRPFFRSWRGAALGVFLLAVILAGCFSWWLSQGKISSAYGRVDAVVYTVEPEQTARVEQILVQQGEDVRTGQPLARVDAATAPPPQPPLAETSSRLSPTQENERQIAARLVQARLEEDKYQRLYQTRVTEHVRAQLYMRSLNPQNIALYDQARQLEESSRAVAELARQEFEKISKARATIEAELDRIRIELSRKKQRQPVREQTKEQNPLQQVVTTPAIELLYAPVNGKILDINARPGQTLQKGYPVFIILPAGNQESWIQAWFPLSAQKMLKLGQKASIKSGDLHLIGQVTEISTEAQYLPPEAPARNSAQYLPVRIQPEDPEGFARLAPGANVECQIQTRYVLDESIF